MAAWTGLCHHAWQLAFAAGVSIITPQYHSIKWWCMFISLGMTQSVLVWSLYTALLWCMQIACATWLLQAVILSAAGFKMHRMYFDAAALLVHMQLLTVDMVV